MESSLIIPAHNEQGRLPATLTSYGEAMSRRFAKDFEIIVVANGCEDDTVAAATRASAVRPQVRVVDVAEKVGKGGAVLEGFRRANGNGVAFADADGATAPRSLLSLFDRLESHDVVIGSRKLGGSIVPQRQPLVRRALGTGFSMSAKMLFGLPFRDTQCGAKAFRWTAARRLLRVVSETRWTFDLDLLVAARKLDLEVCEQPVAWADRVGTRLAYGPTTLEVLQALWEMKLRQGKPLPELPEQPILGREHEREPHLIEESA